MKLQWDESWIEDIVALAPGNYKKKRPRKTAFNDQMMQLWKDALELPRKGRTDAKKKLKTPGSGDAAAAAAYDDDIDDLDDLDDRP